MEQNTDGEGFLALHFHRDLDDRWYALGNFRDKSIGKSGKTIVASEISPDVMNKIVALLKQGRTQ